jgi:hypothetical protein
MGSYTKDFLRDKSEKDAKREAHRKLRRRTKVCLLTYDPDTSTLPRLEELSNPQHWIKGGYDFW